MRVIGVTGLPGSGKSIVARIAKSMGFDVIRMGDIIRDEALKRETSVGETAVKLRVEYGKYVVAERCIDTINQLKTSGNQKFIIEGIRSPAEVNIFKKNFRNFKVIAIHSSPKTRFLRLKKRQRSDDFAQFNEFNKRDKRELNFGIGAVIATANYMIVNEGPIRKFKNSTKSILTNEIKKNKSLINND